MKSSNRIIYKGWIQRYSDVFKTLVEEKESKVLNPDRTDRVLQDRKEIFY